MQIENKYKRQSGNDFVGGGGKYEDIYFIHNK